ncbi:hypothetical protein PHLCEN_2v10644 [Hermanssonia centrifuga]|uniref:Uncharacterized protein n=1 Tax=Hermanssonia centrifuga TaxID=98765 RepID=A0A2R6NMG2_9APHY|nr:hypothetical protein PHLCEN_2v10644 [Hermanssonia centrifuga]
MSVRPIPSSDTGSVVAHGRLDRVGACPGQQAIQIPVAQVLESQPILESEVQDVHRGAAILPEKFDEMSFARVGLILAR